MEDRLREHVRVNSMKSALLVVGFPFVLPVVSFCFVLVLAGLFGSRDVFSAASSAFVVVLMVVGVATAVWLPIGYLMSQTIIDAVTGARLVGRSDERRLWSVFETLCRKCGMRPRALRIIETDALNAFASGLREGQYSVTVTRGLLNALDDDELEAVLAHELTHIRNHDCRLLVVATILVGLVPMLHDGAVRVFWVGVTGFLNVYRAIFSVIPFGFVQLIVAASYTGMYWAGKGIAYAIGAIGHFCSLVIHFSLSRKREFMADAGAVEMTGNPDALISALRKVSCNSEVTVKIDGIREMMFESRPLAGLFATHPPIEDRIAAIVSYADALRQRADNHVARADHVPPEANAPVATVPVAPLAPDPAMVDRYRQVLARAMDGRPELVEIGRRRAIYRRARSALMDGLKGTDPPLPPGEVARLERALEAAIASTEAEATSHRDVRQRLAG